MSREPVEFALKDSEGEDVEYRVVLHPGSEALEIIWNLMQAGAQPLASLLEGNLGRLLEALTSEQEVDLADFVNELDLKLGSAVGDVFQVINSVGGPKLIREILSHTYRNGVSLKKTQAFDAAYTANYAEMIRAVVKVTQVNRFLELFRTSIASFLEVREATGKSNNTISSLEELGALASTGLSGGSG